MRDLSKVIVHLVTWNFKKSSWCFHFLHHSTYASSHSVNSDYYDINGHFDSECSRTRRDKFNDIHVKSVGIIKITNIITCNGGATKHSIMQFLFYR